MRNDRSSSAPRDLRLDFIRGLALLIIYVNHIPLNEGRFFTFSLYGFSDAAEVFVFCSGIVSAWAFGRCFERSGFWLGSLRVLRRCAQIYGANLGLFLALAVIAAIAAGWFPESHYLEALDIGYFFEHSRETLPALALLGFQPEFIDILPMYLVILLWLPVFWAVSRFARPLAMGVSIGLYVASYRFDLNLSARPDGALAWFFNPFAWQLVFFAGFALGTGWMKITPAKPAGVAASIAVILAAIPLSQEPALRPTVWLEEIFAWVEPWTEKCRLGPLRLLHFAAMAYLAASLLRTPPRWLASQFARYISAAGAHSLAIFCLGVVLARAGGIVLDQAGHGLNELLVINFGGIALLLAAAQWLEWLKGNPWNPATHGPQAERMSSVNVQTNEPFPRGAALASPVILALAISPFLLPKTLANAADGSLLTELESAPSAEVDIETDDDGDEPESGNDQDAAHRDFPVAHRNHPPSI